MLIQTRGGSVIAKSLAEDNRQTQPDVEHQWMTCAEHLPGERQGAFVVPSCAGEVGRLRIEDGDLEQRSDRFDVRAAVARFSDDQRSLERRFRAGVVAQRHQHTGEAAQRGRDRQVVWTEGFLLNGQGTLEQRRSAGRVAGKCSLERKIREADRQIGMPGPENLFLDGDRPLGQSGFLPVRHRRRAAHGAAKEIEHIRRFEGVTAEDVFNPCEDRARDVLGLDAASAIEEIRDRGQRGSEAL